jgi:hypothetical protein
VAVVLYEIILLSVHATYPTHLFLLGFSNLMLLFKNAHYEKCNTFSVNTTILAQHQ